MCRNQLLLAGLSTGSVYFLTVPSDHTVRPLYTLYTFKTDFPRESVYDFQRKHGHDIDCHVLAVLG